MDEKNHRDALQSIFFTINEFIMMLNHLINVMLQLVIASELVNSTDGQHGYTGLKKTLH